MADDNIAVRLAVLEAEHRDLRAQVVQVGKKLDRLTFWLLTTLAASTGSLGLLLFRR